MTEKTPIPARAADGTEFVSWGDLVTDRANGYIVTAVHRKGHPFSMGPFADKAPAQACARRLRRMLRAQHVKKPSVYVRPLWQPEEALQTVRAESTY